jgi:hypothetical protein
VAWLAVATLERIDCGPDHGWLHHPALAGADAAPCVLLPLGHKRAHLRERFKPPAGSHDAPCWLRGAHFWDISGSKAAANIQYL